MMRSTLRSALDQEIWDAHHRRRTPLIMGIVNITPDSFFDGGRADPALAIAHAHRLIEDGSDLLDLGAESSRPGSAPVDLDSEWQRLEPVLAALVSDCPIPISVDTYKPEIARRALAMGVEMINDITGLSDPLMRRVVAETHAWACVMHMQATPADMQVQPTYMRSCHEEVISWLQQRLELCMEEGCPSQRIVVDPGIGFGKTLEHNLDLLAHLEELRALGAPILLGLSRKSFIGQILHNKVEDRLVGTLAVHGWCTAHGHPAILRVHDVRAHVETFKMVAALEGHAGLGTPSAPL
ncbi:MAG: dihydropteroate synthase [Chlamydiia bacterium]